MAIHCDTTLNRKGVTALVQQLQHVIGKFWAFATDLPTLAITATATTATSIFGGFDEIFQVFLLFVIIDLVTGVLKGFFSEKQFSSRRMRQGFATKIGYLCAIALAVGLDRILPDNPDMPLLRTVAIWFYIVVEASSIIENLAQMGVPVPKFLVDRLEVLRGKQEKAQFTENDKIVKKN